MKHFCRGLSVILVLLWVVVGVPAAVRAEYEILSGKGTELCEVCLQNLLRQSAEEAVCDRRYALDLGFGQPDSETLDLEKHVELYKRVANLVDRGKEDFPKPDLGDPKEREEFLKVQRMTRTALSAAHVDIDNDGRPDHVLKYQSGNCRKNFHGYHIFYQSALLVVASDQRTIDYPKSDLLAQYPLLDDLKSKNRDRWRIGLSHSQMYQVFTYKGRVYFDRWDGGSGPDTNTLSIYEARQGQARRACQIRLFPSDSAPHN